MKNLEASTKKLMQMGMVPAGIWEHKALNVCRIHILRIRGQVADMLGKNEQASLDNFLEVENMELECELAFSACYSATSCSEGRWNDDMSKAWRKQMISEVSCNKVRGQAGAVCCERRDGGMQGLGWDTLGARESMLVCSVIAQRYQKFLVKTAKLLWWKRKQIQVCSSSESKRSPKEKCEGHWTEKRKNRGRQWGDQRCGHAGCYV